MAKTKTRNDPKQKDILRSTSASLVKSPPRKSQRSIEDLLTEAAALLEQSQPELALPLAEEALQRLETDRRQQDDQKEDNFDIEELLSLTAEGKPTLPTALVINAEILVALGDIDPARRSFLRATQIDKDGALISAEPWLWLAQLCGEGGRESIRYFEQACEVLRNEIDVLEEAINEMETESEGHAETRKTLDDKKAKLATALCAMAEVYMTDLSWENDAEAKCEAFVTEAVAVCPDYLSAGVLQTLASVRISQGRIEDARTSLKRSLDIWYQEPSATISEDIAEPNLETDNDDRKPDYATRVSLSRLLMEVELLQLALSVLQGLVREDDQSIECWYLGGWCQVLLYQESEITAESKTKFQETARTWLQTCLRLYRVQDYDDERLRDHANELTEGLKKELDADGEIDEEGGDGWEDVDEEQDDEEDDLELELEDEDEVNGHSVTHKAENEDVEMT